MGDVFVGTSGYSYDDWVGPVYPKGTRRSDFLDHYARRFSFTELNFTYYRQPTRSGLAAIRRKVPEGFLFTVKAHQSLTHDRSPGWERQAEHFLDALSALSDHGAGGALAGVLLQFPYSFHYTTENRRYLASLTHALRPVRLFVEFRTADWDQESVWREMERRELGLVVPDLPKLDGLPRIAPRLTAPWGYVRFHGRNRDTWWSGTNVTRYDYRYSAEELAEWTDPVRSLAAGGEAVLVAFNNHFAGQAVENAQEFAAMIGAVA
ncbi:MAG: DUF72 domain-containing protein [Spirochaetota bacterium]